LKELEKNRDIIIFIDEIHNIIGAGGTSGSMDAANILKPALSRGDISCIGSTTLDEYKKHIESDSALERRFQKVYVNTPSAAETLEIISKIRSKYQDFHKVSYSEEILIKIVELSDRYMP
jgi:ATP-dependent Clp protease ATP-binding subunit ClpC